MSTSSRSSSPTTHPPESDAEYDQAKHRILERLFGFGELKENWDSYGANPIDQGIIETAGYFLTERVTGDIPLPSVVPTPSGGVQFEWHCRGIDLEIEFHKYSQVGLFFEDLRTSETQELKLSADWEPLAEMLDRLKDR